MERIREKPSKYLLVKMSLRLDYKKLITHYEAIESYDNFEDAYNNLKRLKEKHKETTIDNKFLMYRLNVSEEAFHEKD